MTINILTDLDHFTGTEQWYRHALNRNILYTDGARYVADNARAYWLLDAIVIAQLDTSVRGQPFQVWKLAVEQSRGILTCEDGNGGGSLYRQEMTFTDFPAPGVTLWFIDNVVLLPSEY
jgi:hypothetical protein